MSLSYEVRSSPEYPQRVPLYSCVPLFARLTPRLRICARFLGDEKIRASMAIFARSCCPEESVLAHFFSFVQVEGLYPDLRGLR
jgi:hypothetical protein